VLFGVGDDLYERVSCVLWSVIYLSGVDIECFWLDGYLDGCLPSSRWVHSRKLPSSEVVCRSFLLGMI